MKEINQIILIYVFILNWQYNRLTVYLNVRATIFSDALLAVINRLWKSLTYVIHGN